MNPIIWKVVIYEETLDGEGNPQLENLAEKFYLSYESLVKEIINLVEKNYRFEVTAEAE